MKISTSIYRALLMTLGAFSMAPLPSAFGADSSALNINQATNATVPSAPAKLPYGVEDVLKLSRADVSDDIILKYVQNSGPVYSLTPQDIVFLRSQGVSDRVINAMLEQRKRVEVASQNRVQASTRGAPAPSSGAEADVAPGPPDSAPPPNPQGPVEAPLTPPASSTYVIPYASAPYYDYYPYYGPYYGVWGPTVIFGFGGHGYYHGYHGGYYHGGGFHGGFHGGGSGFHGGGGFHGGHR